MSPRLNPPEKEILLKVTSILYINTRRHMMTNNANSFHCQRDTNTFYSNERSGNSTVNHFYLIDEKNINANEIKNRLTFSRCVFSIALHAVCFAQTKQKRTKRNERTYWYWRASSTLSTLNFFFSRFAMFAWKAKLKFFFHYKKPIRSFDTLKRVRDELVLLLLLLCCLSWFSVKWQKVHRSNIYVGFSIILPAT